MVVVFVYVHFHRCFVPARFLDFHRVILIHRLSLPDWTQLQIEGNGRDPVIQDSPCTIKIGEPVSGLFVGEYIVVMGSESLECAVSHALSVQDVAEGGHRCFDTTLGDLLELNSLLVRVWVG